RWRKREQLRYPKYSLWETGNGERLERDVSWNRPFPRNVSLARHWRKPKETRITTKTSWRSKRVVGLIVRFPSVEREETALEERGLRSGLLPRGRFRLSVSQEMSRLT
ncbi:hypothetical protein K0M31_014709, partial [Melipona bicolor]